MPYFTYPYIGLKQQCTSVPTVFPPAAPRTAAWVGRFDESSSTFREP